MRKISTAKDNITITDPSAFAPQRVERKPDPRLGEAERMFFDLNFPGATAVFADASNAGDGRAAYFMGVYYLRGLNRELANEPDTAAALALFKKGAKAGEPLCLPYAIKNRDKNTPGYAGLIDAVYRAVAKGAQAGDVFSQHEFALMHAQGTHWEADLDEHIKWLTAAAKAGYFLAMYDLSAAYAAMEGASPEDAEESLKWLERAADAGYVTAQYKLAKLYAAGRGGPKKDARVAFAIYQMLAEDGYRSAQTSLADCYFNGAGVRQDLSAALYWYQKAAEQGDALAASRAEFLLSPPPEDQ